MKEIDAIDFMQTVMDDAEDVETRERTLEHASGKALTVTVSGVDRKLILDQLKRLPDDILDTLMGAEDPEEAEAKAREEGQLNNVGGATIDAFERIAAHGMDHVELDQSDFEQLVQKFELDVLFPIGAEVMELTFDDDGGIVDFHEVE
jgi:hypothetical protein